MKQNLENFTSKSLGPDPDPTVPKMFRIHNTAKYVRHRQPRMIAGYRCLGIWCKEVQVR